MTSKGLTVLEMLSVDPTGETYGFVDREQGAVTHIATGVIKQMMRALGQHLFPLTMCEFGETLCAAFEKGELGVEEDHAMRLPEEALKVPAIIGLWGENHIMLDGAHRVWRHWKRGDREFPAYVMPEYAWREFVVTGIPGSAEQWHDFNKNAKIRTEANEMLRKAMGGL